ncbi:hypothetical protein CLAIMM_15171 isoform 2 [Cladophialophora immunda]|nr:hypothetical protein CLAIMM_15171 isoform 2 [Cladophialophora immunda]
MYSNLELLVASEFVAVVCPVLRMRGSTITRILRPAPNIGNCIVSSQFCLKHFRDYLRTFISVPIGASQPSLGHILTKCDKIVNHANWDKENSYPRGYEHNQAKRELLDSLHDACDAATEELRNLGAKFEFLLRNHVHELFVMRDCLGDDERARSSWNETIMEHYFTNSGPATIKRAQIANIFDAEQKSHLVTYWVTMIFRSLCWYNLHCFKFKFAPVDSQYFESQLPVYIG